MNTSTLSPQALAVIDGYLHFTVGSATCSVPYFNNKTTRSRVTLRAYIGKGSPDDILEETKILLVKNHIDPTLLTDESLKKMLADNNIGLDCSAFAYHVLDAENDTAGHGPLDSQVSFVNCTGIFGKMRCSLRPAENCDVATLADDANSRAVAVVDAKPSDIITMIGGPDSADRDHILVIHETTRQNDILVKISYSHAVAYPHDGLYGTGVKQGVIQVTDPHKSLLEQLWVEGEKEGSSNPIFARATAARTELRRLKWL